MRIRWPILLAIVAYFGVASTTVRGVGLVGEVAASWALPAAPRVVTHLEGPVESRVERGPLEVRGTRPVLSVGGWPLAVNAYTGGLADWPARAVSLLTGRWALGAATNVVLGGVFLVLTARFLRFHGTEAAAAAAAWLLATDWCFVFYRKVLAGTETLLLAAGLLVLWSLWSRRWKGGVHGTLAIALGVGLGLHAKFTFAASLAAWAVTALVMRWDRAALRPPRPVSPWLLVALPVACLLPLVLANALTPSLGPAATRSHDTVALQLARLSQATPDREGWLNLVYFLGNPNAWFGVALDAEPVAPVSVLRLLGFGVTVVGAGLAWRERSPTAPAALLRFLSIAVPLQVLLLFAANHDLHHLAQASPPLLILVALAADRAAAQWAPPRSSLRSALTAVFVLPHVIAGILHLATTDRVVATLPRSTFTEVGQAELVAALRDVGCTRLVTSDYEVHGMIDARAPEVDVTHTWAAVANGERDGVGILRLAVGGCYLSLRPTAPMIYDWHPSAVDVERVAAKAGVTAERRAQLTDAKGEWAAIYTISAR